MNKFKIAIAAAAIGFVAAPMNAQAADATGDATATIVAPIVITKVADLDFGTVAPTASSGTVTIANNGTRSGDANVDLLSTDTGNAGQFTITGEGTSAISASIPGINLTGAGDNMPATFTNDAPANLTGGAATINVGGALTVGANQAAGSYTGTFTLTVAYN